MILLQQGFLSHLKTEGKSSTTVDISRNWLEHFEAFCLRVGVAEPNAGDLTRYHKELVWEPNQKGRLYAPNTVNQAIGVIRAFLRWAYREGHLKKDLGKHLKMSYVPRGNRRELKPAEQRKLLSMADPRSLLGARDKALLSLLLETALPRTVCARLNLKDLSLETAVLLSRGRTRGIHGLSDGLVEDLAAYLRQARPVLAQPGTSALFVTRDGRRMNSATVGRLLKTYAERAGVPAP